MNKRIFLFALTIISCLLAGCGFEPFSDSDLNWAIKQTVPSNSKIISIKSMGSGFDPAENITARFTLPNGTTLSNFKLWEQKQMKKNGWKIDAVESNYMGFSKQGGAISCRTYDNFVLINLSFNVKEKTENNIKKYFEHS